MWVWHGTTMKKLARYRASKRIFAPVRAWETITHAERFSRSTQRHVILRLKFPGSAPKLPGHFNAARVLYRDLPLRNQSL